MSDARILDQGYRPYDGPRRGVAGSVRSLAWHSVLRALGLRRTGWAKVLPIASALIAYLPAAVFVGVATLLPERVLDRLDALPAYPEYYGFITAAIVLFVALVGPEVLCPDRRNGMLSLYLASPLNRDTYVAAKVLAVLPVLALVTLGPPLLLLIGLTAADAGPDTAGDVVLLVVRIVVSGVVISATYTAISLAASAMTDRRAVASAAIILLLLSSAVATSTLVSLAGTDEHVLLLNLFFLPFELVQRVYGEVGDEPTISTAALLAAELAWTVAGAVLLRWRYQTLRVTR